MQKEKNEKVSLLLNFDEVCHYFWRTFSDMCTSLCRSVTRYDLWGARFSIAEHSFAPLIFCDSFSFSVFFLNTRTPHTSTDRKVLRRYNIGRKRISSCILREIHYLINQLLSWTHMLERSESSFNQRHASSLHQFHLDVSIIRGCHCCCCLLHSHN